MSNSRLLVVFGVAMLCLGSATDSIAQGSQTAASGVAISAGVAASAPLSKKAQLKADRKQARARRTAEIKSLQGAGYRSQQTDPDYPQNLLNAQKKAAAAGASQ